MKAIPPPQKDFDIYIARPETLWLLRDGDPLADLYAAGYMPYSGAKESTNIFYSGRSARIVLPEFQLSSENRRIAKKFDGMFEKRRVPMAEFVPDETFWTLCLAYFEQKHGAQTMPRERIEALFKYGIITTVVMYLFQDMPVAYVLEVEDADMAYYWYSYYDLEYAKQSLGLWLMLDSIRDAQTRGLQFYYLGTVYGEKALYKTNFAPLEWWDNSAWSRDLKALKANARG